MGGFPTALCTHGFFPLVFSEGFSHPLDIGIFWGDFPPSSLKTPLEDDSFYLLTFLQFSRGTFLQNLVRKFAGF